VATPRHIIRVELSRAPQYCTHIWNLGQNAHPPTSGLPLAARSQGVLCWPQSLFENRIPRRMEPVPVAGNRLFVMANPGHRLRQNGEYLPCDPLGLRRSRGRGKEVRDDE
jgi:hypothetical protein